MMADGSSNTPGSLVNEHTASKKGRARNSDLKKKLASQILSITLEQVRKVTINLLVVGGSILVVLVVGHATFKDVYQFEAISIPQMLKDRGYTGELVAQRILDEIAEINRKSVGVLDDHGRYSTSELTSPMLKVDVPGSSVSLETVVFSLRQFSNIVDTKIGGDVLNY